VLLGIFKWKRAKFKKYSGSKAQQCRRELRKNPIYKYIYLQNDQCIPHYFVMCVYYESTAVKLCTDCVYRLKLLMKLLLLPSLEKVVEEVNILILCSNNVC